MASVARQLLVLTTTTVDAGTFAVPAFLDESALEEADDGLSEDAEE